MNSDYPGIAVKCNCIKRFVFFSFVLSGLLSGLSVLAQPSGGPYGPVRQTYQLPKADGKIYYVAPDGNKEAKGESLDTPAAVKIFNQCYRVTCQDNLIMDLPYSNGIWYDVGNVDGRFLNNWVEGVGIVNTSFSGFPAWPGVSGFFFEISKGAVCAGNVFVNCESGVHILNSCE